MSKTTAKPTRKRTSAAAFLANLQDPVESSPASVASAKETPAAPPSRTTRDGLKHIGGYFPPDDVEKVAILRARLKLDNSELIALAINELWKAHQTKKAFDA